MLMIRLQRMGKKKNPTYRFIINEKARDTQAKSLEILGHYNPTENPKVLELNTERIKYWLSVGAQTSETVHNILVKEGVIEGKKRKSVTITNKRKIKIEEKQVAEAEKKKAAKEKAEAEKASAEEEKKAGSETTETADDKTTDIEETTTDKTETTDTK